LGRASFCIGIFFFLESENEYKTGFSRAKV
jgi:hypothetical protein